MVSLGSFLLGSVATIFSYKLSRVIYRCVPYIFSKKQIKSMGQGEFIIITGSTDGIGKQYVRMLLKEKYFILAIGRNQNKLENLKRQMGENSEKIITLQMDFSSSNINILQKNVEKITQKIIERSQDLKNIKGIINCCGSACFDQYRNLKLNQIQSLHSVNLNSINTIMKLFVQNQQKSPFLINVSSVSAREALKYSTVYSAVKAYQNTLMRSVQKEVNQNCQMLNIQPFYVKTKMINYRKDWMTVQPLQIVLGSLSLLNWKRKQGMGCLKHQIIDEFYDFFQGQIGQKIDKMYQNKQKIEMIRKQRLKK